MASEVLLDVRRRAGITQSELARRADVPRSVISAYEHGRRDPGAEMLARLVRAAGFHLTVVGTEPHVGPDPVRAGRRLSEVLELADALPKRRRDRPRYPRIAHE